MIKIEKLKKLRNLQSSITKDKKTTKFKKKTQNELMKGRKFIRKQKESSKEEKTKWKKNKIENLW